MKRTLICLCCLMAAMAVQAQTVTIKKGTKVQLKSVQAVGLENYSNGETIEFEVGTDVFVDGVVAIPKGTKAVGEITNVSSGISDESFTYCLSHVMLSSGEQIPLDNKKIKVKGTSPMFLMMGGERAMIKKGAAVTGIVSTNSLVDAVANRMSSKQAEPQVTIRIGKEVPISDVDENIPQAKGSADNTFAVIIANEYYVNEADVDFAHHDGDAFRNYCLKTLGLPRENIHYRTDATKNNIETEIDWVSKVANAFGSDAKVIIYYAGHGIPDDKTGAAYLLPVDGTGSNYKTGYSTAEMYKQLSALPAGNVVVLMDACFSGTKRGEGMLTAARGVAIKAKMSAPQGNLVVLTAAQDDETAHPYTEKGHGMFTYFLLKKLQDSKGNCTLAELSDYVKTQVTRRSIIVNGKSQTPTVSSSVALGDRWKTMTLK